MSYYVRTSPILSLQIFGHLLDVASLLLLYATERKCCDELAMHSSPTMKAHILLSHRLNLNFKETDQPLKASPSTLADVFYY